MTKKHYVALAAAITRARDRSLGTFPGVLTPSHKELQARAVDIVAREVAEVLYADNPACDPERFLAAAGVEQ